MSHAQELTIDQFLEAPGLMLDVRSPGEFQHARIPGAINLPLFEDDERALVGTAYKQKGRGPAIELGLKLVGPKLADFVAHVKKLSKEHSTVRLKVHCWRGGMRSASMAWLLGLAGFETITLPGGYKAFRGHVLKTLEKPLNLYVIGGFTGCGKTAILHALKDQGEQVIDLEQIAHHKGSSYGMIGMPLQPSIEQFENELAMRILALDPTRRVWVEDESRMIGACKIPDCFFKNMHQSKLYVIHRPLDVRIRHLLNEYGTVRKASLMEATQRLSRRLGGALTTEIAALVESGNLTDAIAKVLKYYDSTYKYGLSKRASPCAMEADNLPPSDVAKLLINF